MTRLSLITPVVAALVIAACGSSSSSSSNSGSAPASSSSSSAASSSGSVASGSSVKVDMKNLAFNPDTVHAKVGQTITWTNDDTPPHNVTWVSGPKFTSSGTMNPGQSFSLKVTSADVGVIHYVCTIHPFMTATIVVSQ
jgi:plastocyanin